MQFLPVLRSLVCTYQSFERYSALDVKAMGLTTTQFDVIATLGNQPPMTCKELGEKTLVTKGTLTGVLERLEGKGILEKMLNPEDGRSQMIGLTKNGQALFEKIFPRHMQHLDVAFKKLTTKQIQDVQRSLDQLKEIFNE